MPRSDGERSLRTDAHPPLIEHLVSEYDSQREGMALVSGWRVQAQVTGITGRKFAPVTIAICPSKDDADEIAELLTAKYGGAHGD